MNQSSSHPSTSPLTLTPPAAAAADNGEAIVKMATRDNFLPSSPSITPTTHQMNWTHSPPSIASLTSAGDNRARYVTTTQDIANRAAANSNVPPFSGPGALMNLVQRFTNNTVLPTGNINDNFNVNDFIQQANANMQSNGLRPEDGRMQMPDEEDHNDRMPIDGEQVDRGNVAEMNNDDNDDDDNDNDDDEDEDEIDDGIESDEEEEEIHDEIVHNFIHTFTNGDYDLEFDEALSWDQAAILPNTRATQASYNKPDNWVERNRIGLEKVKEQVQTRIDSVSRGTVFSFNLDLRHNSRFNVHQLMANEEPIVWYEPDLDRYWYHFSAAIDQRMIYTDICGIQLENVEMTKESMAALVNICLSGNVKISSPFVGFNNANLCREGIVWLSKLINVSSQLQEFCLRHNRINNIESARCLSRSLKSHTCIDQLIITHCELGNSPEILSVILQSDVRRISLSNNNIDSLGAVTIAEYLEGDPPIEEMFLEHNRLNDDDAMRISQALKRNTHLDILHIHFNNLTSIGVKALLTCVFDSSSLNAISESNHTLTEMILFLGQITGEISCSDKLASCINRLLSMDWTQKILLALQYKNSLIKYLANIPVELIPEVLAFHLRQANNESQHRYLNIVYFTMRWWNMPMLYSYHKYVKSDTKRKRDD